MKLKSLFSTLWNSLGLTLCIFTLLGMLALFFTTGTPKAEAQVTAQNALTFTNAVFSLTTSQTLALTSGSIDIKNGRGLAFTPTFWAASATVSNLVWRFELSTDGTNWTTTTPINLTNVLNGTTIVRAYNVIPWATLEGYQKIKLREVQNFFAGGVTVSNNVVSIAN